MKTKITTLMMVLGLLFCGKLQAQLLLFDDFEGNGPCSGHWNSYLGTGTPTGSVLFNVANPSISGLNTSSHVAKFTKDTTCSEWMLAGCTLSDSLDISKSSIFKVLVYSSLKEEVLFKLQPGANYGAAVYFTYKIKNANTWEEATYDFSSVKNRKDFNRIEVHWMDGKKANGILYFDYILGPNPTTIILDNAAVAMGQENGTVLTANLHGDVFKATLNKNQWHAANLPPGVSIDSVLRINDTTAHIVLGGNSAVVYSRSTLKMTIDSSELAHPSAAGYTLTGNVVFDGNPNWTMVFDEEFNTTGMPDFSKWTVEPRPKGWINGEQQVYTDTSFDNTRVRNGSLVITGKKDYPNIVTTEPYSSGRILTQNKFDFKYGKVEVRAKLPKARGSWPAIWLMPTTSAYGAWPASGELDIMEHVGNSLGKVLSTVHTKNNNWTNGSHTSGNKTISTAHTAFHTYTMEWTEDSIRFTYDDSIHCYTYQNPHTDWKDWPFDQKFHIILNLAMGGGMGGSITDADFPDSLLIDYVRVYQKGLGTPVLDSMTISPLGRAVVAGKQLPFTAKVYDQNQRLMSVTPTWSITGAGNTIDCNGLATFNSAGIVTARAIHNGDTLAVSANTTLRTPNYKPIPARIEAENNDYTNICCTETASDTSGNLNVSYIGAGSWLEYDINVPATRQYRFQFRVAVSTASTLQLVLDNNVISTVKLPVSGGWQTWSTVTSEAITLPAGNQTIRVQALTSGWNFNWLKIVNADDLAVTRVQITPDSSSVFVRGRKQFTAAAYGADNSRFDVPFTWSATAGIGSFDYKGIFTADSTEGLYNVYATAGGFTGNARINILGMPRLSRIQVVPDTIVIPYRASQLFTAKGFDQYGAAFAFTGATWSVTGSGNTITQAGALTTGTNPGIVTAAKDTLSGSGVFTLGYLCTFNKRYQAESASSRHTVPTLETTTDTSGGQNFTGLLANHWFAYNAVGIPVRGKYNIRFRVLTTATARIRMEESGINFGYINLPNTNGEWATISDTITLPAISYINVRVQSGSFKFNWWSLDNCAVDSSAGGGMAASNQRIRFESLDNAIKVYPNPTTSNITVDLGQHDYQVADLMDLSGRLIRRWNIRKGDTRITKPVSFLESGTYILRFEGASGGKSVQFIKL